MEEEQSESIHSKTSTEQALTHALCAAVSDVWRDAHLDGAAAGARFGQGCVQEGPLGVQTAGRDALHVLHLGGHRPGRE
eukprot:809217-Rhodomonas_salina.2